MNEYYLNRFTNEKDPELFLRSTNLEKFYVNIKMEFFNSISCKWSLKAYKNFVIENKLNFGECYSILLKFANIYFQEDKKGKKGFLDFLNKIEKIKKNFDSKIRIKTNPETFLNDLQKLRLKHFEKISNKDFLKFIDCNFDTEYTKDTTRKYLYESRFFKK